MRTITTSTTIEATPARVWEHLTDFASHEEWNPFFATIEGEATAGSQIVITARKGEGTGMSFTPTILVAEPDRELRWLGKLAFGKLFDGEHFFILHANDDGSTTFEHGEHFSGVLIPFMGKVLRETEEGFIALNEALKQRAEASARERA